MARFSPSVMARLSSIDVDVQSPYHKHFKGTKRFFRFQGTWSQWLDLIREAQSTPSLAQQAFQDNLQRKFPSTWAGITDSLPTMLSTATYSDALREFNQTKARLESSHFQLGAPRPAVAGGAWIISLCLSSNPLPARLRPRSKLPPVNLEVSLSVVNSIAWQDITRSIATLARAIWNYIQAGGAATLTVHYCAGFNLTQDGHHGFISSLTIPTSNIAAFASAASAQEFRGLFLSFGLALSGQSRDRGIVTEWKKPGLAYLSGKPADDAKVLQSLRIQ
jgi:hypothetical protein